MSRPAPASAGLSGLVRQVGATVLWAAALVAVLIAAREVGLFEPLEFVAYDVALRARPEAGAEPKVAVVAIDDDALEAWGWPVPDGVLASLINAVVDAGALAVAVDIYRDRPVPPGSDLVDQAFARPNVFGAMKFAEGGEPAVAPPPALADAGRFGFVDFPVDEDGVMRRTLLYLDDGTTVLPSLALKPTLYALDARGIRPRADPSDPAAMRLGAATIKPIDASAGPYASADSGGYQILLDFRREDGAIPVVDAQEVVRDPAAGAALKDRVVFIGIASDLVKDLVVAPVRGATSSGLVHGVMLHAWTADQLIRLAEDQSNVLILPSAWGEDALIAAAAVVALALGIVVASSHALVAAAAALLGLSVGGAFLLFRADIWVPVAPATIAAAGSLAIAVGGRAAGERRTRQTLMRLFAQQVSAEVAGDLWRRREALLEDGLPRPQRLAATILFLDLAGSTSIADRLAPEVYVDWVGRFLERMAETAIDNRGLVDKYTGDGLMVVFGAPVPRHREDEIADDARAALSCARAMAAALSEFNAGETAAGRPPARIRIGIHSGPVFAGCVGAARRRQYTVMGAAVNAAARLEALKEIGEPAGAGGDCRILLSQTTASLVGADTGLVAAGAVTLRGFSAPIEVYQLEDAA